MNVFICGNCGNVGFAQDIKTYQYSDKMECKVASFVKKILKQSSGFIYSGCPVCGSIALFWKEGGSTTETTVYLPSVWTEPDLSLSDLGIDTKSNEVALGTKLVAVNTEQKDKVSKENKPARKQQKMVCKCDLCGRQFESKFEATRCNNCLTNPSRE